MASFEMAVLTFSMSGLVLSAQVGAAPIILAGTSVTVMKDGVNVAECVSGPDGVFAVPKVAGGVTVLMCAADGHATQRKTVKLISDMMPGTAEAPGKADVIMFPPVDAKFRLEVVLAEYALTLRRAYQHYCSSASSVWQVETS